MAAAPPWSIFAINNSREYFEVVYLGRVIRDIRCFRNQFAFLVMYHTKPQSLKALRHTPTECFSFLFTCLNVGALLQLMFMLLILRFPCARMNTLKFY